MIRKLLIIVAACVLLVAGALPDDVADAAWNKAVAAAKAGDRATWHAGMREAYTAWQGKTLASEDLLRAGAVSLETRKFAEAEKYLEQYRASGGANTALGLALLVRTKAELRNFDGADQAFSEFEALSAGKDTPYDLKRGVPASIEALYGAYMANIYRERGAQGMVQLKQIIDRVGDNAAGWIDPDQLHNYHSWYASFLADRGDVDGAIAFLTHTTYPIFKGNPVTEARTRDRILFIKLDRWIEREEYAAGLAELQATVESFKADNVSFRRVSNALKRFSLYNQPAPELDCDALVGATAPRSLAELRGSVVLLEFFWSGCHPCRESFPLIGKLAAHYKDKPFQVVGMTFLMGSITPFQGPTVKVKDRAEEIALLEKFHADFKLPWPLVVCDDRTNNTNYGEMGVPMTVIIDKKGIVRRITTGYDPTLQREFELIDRLLAE